MRHTLETAVISAFFIAATATTIFMLTLTYQLVTGALI